MTVPGGVESTAPKALICITGDSLPNEQCESSAQGRLITCRVEELRPHPSYIRNQIAIPAPQLARLNALGDLVFREPLIVSQDGTILDGYARWILAQRQGRETLPCVEFDLSDGEALNWLLQKHRRSEGLNAFSRIIMARELEPWLREKARSNMQFGGQMKGSSNLTKADKLNVRSEIAHIAGVSTGNVFKVTQLLLHAKPALLQALREGEVTIHRASLWTQKPEQQLDQLRLHQNSRGITRKVDSLLQKHRRSAAEPLSAERIIDALTAMQPDRLASVLVAVIEIPGEVLLISTTLRQALTSQGEL